MIAHSQHWVANPAALVTEPGRAIQGPMELDVAPNRFLPFQGENYIVPQPPSTNTIICTTEVSPAPPPPPAQLLKPGQGGFKKVCRTEDEGPSPFPGLASGVLEMRVKEGSKIRNLMGFAMTRMQGTAGPEGGQPGLRQVVFTGSGRAVTKTITCAEIMKRKIAGLHQLSKLRYKGVREVWESQEGGGSEMTVHRTVPSISILLSRDPLDPREPGYQPPESLGALWGEQPATKRLPDPPDHAGLPGSKRPCLGNGRVVCGPAE